MYTYLALGDSYTIGEQVEAKDNFPNQTVKLLNEAGLEVELSKLIAVTGWTTDELAEPLLKKQILQVHTLSLLCSLA